MRFLSKIRERQFAKKWGGAYNLSRAVLAGVLAAGCLMPGFAEAAVAPALVTKLDHYITDNDNLITVDRTEGENTATITAVNGNVGDRIDISWEPGAGETSVEGCTINVNSITIVPETYIYGGQGTTAANRNSVSISGGTFKNIMGGWATSSSGTANDNSVEINGGTFNANVSGGQAATAEGNSFIINAGTFNSLISGGDGTTAANRNSVEINGGIINADVSGGYSQYGEANKNSVIINDGTINSYVYGGYAHSNSGTANITANENSVIIRGGTFGSDTVDSYVYGGYSESGTAEGNSVIISGGTINGDVRVWGGWAESNSGNANKNSVSISGGTFNGDVRVWGGLSKSGTANKNSVIISDGKFYNDFYGGKGETAADENSVIISGGKFSRCWVYGGYSESGTANRNQVIISDGTFDGNVVGGSSVKEAKDNKIVLLGKDASYTFTDTQGAKQTITGHGKINITGTVQGGLGSDKTTSGNEIHVYGTNTIVGGIDYFNELNFHIDNNINWAEPMLIISGAKSTSITKDSVAITFDGNPQDNATNKSITLVRDEKGTIEDFIGTKDIDISATIGATLTVKGTVALNKEKNKLIFTLADNTTGEGGSTGGGSTGGGSTGGGESGPTITVNENGKSLVETRAAAAFVVNNMSDFMLGTGMEQAKAAAGGVAPIDAGTMAPFAAVGGSNMRYTTGSYVDVNGWNGAVGFAKQADKLLFGVAVEHGRGNYDSYLDNGVHASGDIKSTGGVIFGEYKLDNGVHYDAALRAGRVKSDYSSTATSYDESSTYYGFSLGGGKELTVSDKATVDVYGRYYFSHTNGSDVSIATGEEIDFDAVNSHRLRIGGRYTTTLTEKSKAYAGLAWQYEFGGDAKAAINGYSAPTPSLQGHSAIVEAGYKLNAGKNLTLDFNLNGAMGKQRGIGGGIGAQWLF